MRTSTRRNGLTLLLLATVVAPAGPGTLVVDDDFSTPYPTIQSAVDAALPGIDDVFVRCGTYVENVVMRDGVSVRGHGPQCAVIDGGLAGPVVRLEYIGAGTVLEGFTLTRGRDLQGGGVRVLGGRPTITRNVIRDNGQDPFTGLYNYGAGIYVSSGGVDPNTAPVISYNIIRGNGAFGGGGLSLVDVDQAVVTSNLIAGNAGSFGGGLSIIGGSVNLVNNTIVTNFGDYGGGMWVYRSDVVVTNNVFVDNASATSGDIYPVGQTNFTFVSNNTFGNLPYQAYGGAFPGPGNISADPRFVDSSFETFAGFEPRADSPLVDAGSTAGIPATDLLGLPRSLDGNADGNALPDIGARENTGITGLLVDRVRVTWDAGSHDPRRYNVYRGNLQTLLDVGAYVQDPALDPAVRHICDVGGETAPELAEPSSGAVWFYLVAAATGVEGPLGFDSDGVERLATIACQP